ncbi:MAG: serine hydrolase [bacterium]|nr:serine hydrolase [bacterium]
METESGNHLDIKGLKFALKFLLFVFFIFIFTSVSANIVYRMSSEDISVKNSNKSQANNKEVVTLNIGTSTVVEIKIEKEIEKEIEKKIIESFSTSSIPKPYSLTARAYIVANLDTGKVLLSQNSKIISPIASITKLVTALVARDVMSSDKAVLITEKALDTSGDSGHLIEGKKYTASALLYPLLMESSNDTASALSYDYGEEDFISLMNKKAKELGMIKTFFDDPTGLSYKNISSPEDLFKLSRYIYYNDKDLLNITTLDSKKIEDIDKTVSVYENNINIFAKNDKFIGGKTGTTIAAGESIIAMFNIGTLKTPKNIAVIVLGSNDRQKDVEFLLSKVQDKI